MSLFDLFVGGVFGFALAAIVCRGDRAERAADPPELPEPDAADAPECEPCVWCGNRHSDRCRFGPVNRLDRYFRSDN